MTLVRHTLTAASLALLSLLAAAPLTAQANTYGSITIQSGPPIYSQNNPVYLPAPPPPRHEAIPRPRRGQVWVPGHWQWHGRHHVWKSGHWVTARPGYYYQAPRWEQRGGRWYMHEGRWDRNGNGVPDRYEHRYDRYDDPRHNPRDDPRNDRRGNRDERPRHPHRD
ncbi:MAG: YXWGXW repeat-containing protein [Giesbergeria sp.]|nr:YXWGXW repeat-containing protein [Giesbergeria sp.]